jgi:outer membrane protein assembly factor BamB/ferric-dicitrate binding protein FerR (iron transport regulator)
VVKKTIFIMSLVIAALIAFGCEKKGQKESASATQPTEIVEPAPTGEQAASAPEAQPEQVPENAVPKSPAKTRAKPATKEAGRTAEPKRPEPVSGSTEHGGFVTFLSGKVTAYRGDTWEPLDVEDPVEADDRIKTAADSFCEIQFADFGVVRVQESSEIVVRDVFLRQDGSKVDVALQSGRLLCKVSKLGKGDEFQVKTSTALAGVRGTEFVVREEIGKSTVVAVNEGQVTVVPAEIVDRIEILKSGLKTETAKSVLDEIAIPEIVITDRKEVVLETKEMERVVKNFEEVSPIIEQKVKEIDEKAAALETREKAINAAPEKSEEEKSKDLAYVQRAKQDIAGLKESVITQSEKKSTEIEQRLEQPAAVSKTSLRELDEIKRMKSREITVASKDPDDSMKPEGKKPDAEMKKNEPPAHVKVTIEVNPKDSELYVNDDNVGKIKYIGLYPPGTVLVIRAVREGYKTNIYKYTVSGQRSQKIEIELKSPVSWDLKEGSGPFVRKAAQSGNLIVLADRKGRLVCVSAKGKKQWSHVTRNDPNDNSMPVLVIDPAGREDKGPRADLIFFSGSVELVALNIKTGEVVNQIPIGSGRLSSHLFGRRVVPLNGDILFPSDDAIVMLNGSTFRETASIPVPGSSFCTPAVYGGTIVTVNELGELLRIDPETGDVKTKIQTDAYQPASLAPTIVGDVAVFADTKGTVVASDLAGGAVIWQRSLAGGEKGVFTDIETENGRLYVYTGEEFYTISLEDGKDLLGAVASSCLPLISEDRIYFGDNEGRLIVADALSGKVMKSYRFGSPISAQPLLFEGSVLVGTRDGTISMLNLSDL